MWSVNDTVPQRVDAILVISYGAEKARLSRRSGQVAFTALELAKRHPEAVIYWGTFGKGRNEKKEESLKYRMFSGLKHIHVGSVTSTTDEMEAMSKFIHKGQNIVVVMDGSHSKRCIRVWRFFNQDKYIYGVSTPIVVSDLGNPMLLQKFWPVWLATNAVLLPLYWGNGPRRMSRVNFTQPTKEEVVEFCKRILTLRWVRRLVGF